MQLSRLGVLGQSRSRAMATGWQVRPAVVPIYRWLGNALTRCVHVDSRSRLSLLWVPPPLVALKDAKADEESHAKLVRAGFFRQAHSGVFHMLPLGVRVQDKIEAVVDKHMKTIGASRVSLSSISSANLWSRSGRLESVKAELFRFSDRKDAEYLLAPTHEEEITELVAQNVHSYKALPVRLYQITRKYRDEMRPRHGILRSREFVMKDLYTFDVSVDAALATYEEVRMAYAAIFAELKVPVLVARASSGDMGGDLSHEYLLVAALGEDDVASCSHCGFTANTEVVAAAPAAGQSSAATAAGEPPEAHHAHSGEACPSCGASGTLTVQRAIELGHTFYLGTRYTAAMDVALPGPGSSPASDRDGSVSASSSGSSSAAAITPLMGCYGIGISRILGAVADHLADRRGLNWPRAIAPYEVVVISASSADGSLTAAAETVYDVLAEATGTTATTTTYGSPNLDVVLDDRQQASLPWKLKDADLVGYPVIVVVGAAWKRNMADAATEADEKAAALSWGVCEVQCRQLGVRQDVPLRELRTFVGQLLDRL